MFRLRFVLLFVVILVAAGIVVVFVTFVRPRTSPPHRVDAIVVFGAEVPARLATGLSLARRKIAPTLVLSLPDAQRTAQVCRRQRPYRVVCFTPEPGNTRGEAETVGRLAARHRWRSLALVTSRYHLFRAGLLLGRCYHGRVEKVAAPNEISTLALALRAIRESGGVIDAEILSRGC
jgi:uncharacterized SAM-binding protein YcdF (DUF218 family)